MATVGRAGPLLRAALRPSLTGLLADFAEAAAQLRRTRPVPTTVGVVGLTPGEGRSTVAALLALAVAGWTDRRVTVVDAVAAPSGVGPPANGVPRLTDVAGRTVTALLDGDPAQGRLPALLDADPRRGRHQRGKDLPPWATGETTDVVSRARVRASLTPGAAVGVLSLRPGESVDGFPPQLLERALARLRQRSDLVVVDTPAGPGAPVLHAVLRHADHLVAVVRGDGDVDARIAAVLRWVRAAPGARPDRPVTVVVVQRGGRRPRWSAEHGCPVVLLPRDESLRRRRPARAGRAAVLAALRAATAVATAADRGTALPPAVLQGPAGAPVTPLVGSSPHPEPVREPLPRR